MFKVLSVLLVIWFGVLRVASGQVIRPGLPRSGLVDSTAQPPAFLNLQEVVFELVILEPAPGQSLGNALQEYFARPISYQGGPTFSYPSRFWERVLPLIMEDNGITDMRQIPFLSRLWVRPMKVRQILESQVVDRGAFYFALDKLEKIQIEALLSRVRGIPVQIRTNPTEGIEELLGGLGGWSLRSRVIFNVMLFSATFFGTRAFVSALGQERGTF